MIVRIELLQKAVGLSAAEFSQRWLEQNVDLAGRLPGLLRYEQNHVVDYAQRGIEYQRGPEQLDGLSMFWFENEHTMRAAMDSAEGRAMVEADGSLVESQRTLLIDQIQVIPPVTDRQLIKRVSTLRRRVDVSMDQFRHEWRDEHARLVKRISGVHGYRQNHVLRRESPAGHFVDHAEWPIDGVVELWFDDVDSLDAAFASPQGATLMMHAREFIAEITTFLVEPHIIF